MPRKLTGHIETRPKKGPPVTLVVRIGRRYIDSFTISQYPSFEAAELDAKEALRLGLEDQKQRARTRCFASLFDAYMDTREDEQEERRGHSRQFKRNERTLAARYIHTAPFWFKNVDDVKRGEVRALVSGIAGKPAMRFCKRTKTLVRTGRKIGRRTPELVRTRLSDFFDWVPDLADNPAKGVPLPRVKGVVRREAGSDVKPHLHMDEIERLFGLSRDVFSPLMRAVYGCGIYAGLRGGEVVGLEWQHLVRLYGEQPEVHVRNSYDSTTKTQASQREIPMLAQLVVALREYVESLPVRPVRGYVFPGLDGGVRCDGWSANWYARDLGPRPGGGRYVYAGFRELAKVRETILYRQLRHTFATHLLAGRYDGHEWPIEKVSQMLGHSSVAITIKHYVSRDVGRLHDEVAKAQSKTQRHK